MCIRDRFIGGVLGSDQANVSAIQGGTLDMAVMNTGILASVAKELAIFDFPFLFANGKESDALVDGPVGKKLHAKLEAKGLIGLASVSYTHLDVYKRQAVAWWLSARSEAVVTPPKASRADLAKACLLYTSRCV